MLLYMTSPTLSESGCVGLVVSSAVKAEEGADGSRAGAACSSTAGPKRLSWGSLGVQSSTSSQMPPMMGMRLIQYH